MSQVVETLKVKSWGKGQGEFVEINKADFDPEKHELFKEPKGGKKAEPEAPAAVEQPAPAAAEAPAAPAKAAKKGKK